jgi:hypothetical protein
VVASADLAGLGTKEGPPVHFHWTLPSLMPSLLPWLAMLGLLVLPSNRNPRAWWILAPLAVLAAVNASLEVFLEGARNEGVAFAGQAACAASFGLAAVWLLGAGLGRRSRPAAFGLMVPVVVAFGFLAFVTTAAWEEIWDLRSWVSFVLLYALLYWTACGLLFAAALSLTGRICRERFGPGRVCLWLYFWLLALCLAVVTIVCSLITLVSPSDAEWAAPLAACGIVSLVSFAVFVPFLVLSFTDSFWRERLGSLLHVAKPLGAPPAERPASGPALP